MFAVFKFSDIICAINRLYSLFYLSTHIHRININFVNLLTKMDFLCSPKTKYMGLIMVSRSSTVCQQDLSALFLGYCWLDFDETLHIWYGKLQSLVWHILARHFQIKRYLGYLLSIMIIYIWISTMELFRQSIILVVI